MLLYSGFIQDVFSCHSGAKVGLLIHFIHMEMCFHLNADLRKLLNKEAKQTDGRTEEPQICASDLLM